MDITVTLNKDDLYQAMKDYLAKHGQDVQNKSMSVDIKAGRGVAEANIGATVTLSTDPVPVDQPVNRVVEEAPVVEAKPEPKVKDEPEVVAEEKPPFDDDSADDAKKSLFEDPKGRTLAPNNPLFS